MSMSIDFPQLLYCLTPPPQPSVGVAADGVEGRRHILDFPDLLVLKVAGLIAPIAIKCVASRRTLCFSPRNAYTVL